jgi:hypothetical protein
MTSKEHAGGHRLKRAKAGGKPVFRARDVRVAHRLRLLVDRHRSPPSLRRERADRETPASAHSLVHCAEATRLRPTSREACFFPAREECASARSPSDRERSIVNKLRLVREAKAVAFLRRQRLAASALEIGVAALSGEARASAIPPKGKEAIGLSIAVELVRRKLVKVTRENRFYRATTRSAG